VCVCVCVCVRVCVHKHVYVLTLGRWRREDARTAGLARCGIQGYDSAVIEVKESTMGGSRQAVALFDQASISIQDSRVQLPPDSFVVAQNDDTQAKLHRVHVALEGTADTPQGGGGGGVGGSGKDAPSPLATGLATMRCGVFWGSNGNRASLSIKSCSFDGSLAGRREQDDILWGGQTSKVKEVCHARTRPTHTHTHKHTHTCFLLACIRTPTCCNTCTHTHILAHIHTSLHTYTRIYFQSQRGPSRYDLL